MTCQGCAADPHPENSDPRRCAFLDYGTFVSDNWACVTMLALRRYADVRHSSDDRSIGVLEVGDGPAGESGWLVMCWYKHRGATEIACVMNEDGLRD